MKWRGLVTPLLLAAVMLPRAAAAKFCGDNVGGQDVPCACGDTVVSNLVLGDDPVRDAACPSDALIVRAEKAQAGLTIDLRGATLRGSGKGAGVWVVNGGSGGARVISTGGRATITGFMDGIIGHGVDTVKLIDGMTVVGSIRDGMRVEAGGYEIRNSEVRNAGRDGYAVEGNGFQLSGTRAINSARYGYFIMGKEAVLGTPGAGPVSDGSGNVGFSIWGMGHHLVDCVASEAAKNGVELYGMSYDVRGCVASGNHGDGITGMGGGGWFLANNSAVGNDRNGIVVGAGPWMQDGGGNSGSGNRGVGEQRAAAQCEIAGVPCRP